jgi:hypothetical protein
LLTSQIALEHQTEPPSWRFFFFRIRSEAAMTQTTKPSKEDVREWFERRTHAPLDPPPSPDGIRRILGWHLLPQAHQPDRDDRD